MTVTTNTATMTVLAAVGADVDSHDATVETFVVPALADTAPESFDNPQGLVVIGNKVLHPRAERAAVLGEALVAVMHLEGQHIDRQLVLELIGDFYGPATIDDDVAQRVHFFDADGLDLDGIVTLIDPRTPSQQRLFSEVVDYVANKRETTAHLRRAMTRALFRRDRRAA